MDLSCDTTAYSMSRAGSEAYKWPPSEGLTSGQIASNNVTSQSWNDLKVSAKHLWHFPTTGLVLTLNR